MNFTDDIIKTLIDTSADQIFLTLTGDGNWEVYIIKGFCKAFNGKDNYVLFPKTPSPSGRKTGLSSLDSIKYLTSKYRFRNYICIVDKEHVRSTSDSNLKNDLTSRIYKIGRYEFHKSSVDIGVSTEIQWGPHNANLDLIILGKCKCLEENISILIENQYNKRIQPTKKPIRNFLKQKNINLSELITNASTKNLKIAFPALYSFFKNQH